MIYTTKFREKETPICLLTDLLRDCDYETAEEIVNAIDKVDPVQAEFARQLRRLYLKQKESRIYRQSNSDNSTEGGKE